MPIGQTARAMSDCVPTCFFNQRRGLSIIHQRSAGSDAASIGYSCLPGTEGTQPKGVPFSFVVEVDPQQISDEQAQRIHTAVVPQIRPRSGYSVAARVGSAIRVFYRRRNPLKCIACLNQCLTAVGLLVTASTLPR
jgi:hypothetical protein